MGDSPFALQEVCFIQVRGTLNAGKAGVCTECCRAVIPKHPKDLSSRILQP